MHDLLKLGILVCYPSSLGFYWENVLRRFFASLVAAPGRYEDVGIGANPQVVGDLRVMVSLV